MKFLDRWLPVPLQLFVGLLLLESWLVFEKATVWLGLREPSKPWGSN